MLNGFDDGVTVKTGNSSEDGMHGGQQGRHLFLSLKLTFPFLFNLPDVQSTLGFKSTST